MIYRVEAACKVNDDNNLQNISLIVKVPLEAEEEGLRAKIGIFEKESIIYNEVLPKFKSIFGERWKDLTPKLFHTTNEHVLILEDLKESGYKMADRMKLLNFKESKIALSALAKFHAASAKLYETESQLIIKAAREIMFQPGMKQSSEKYMSTFFRCARDSCSKKPDLSKYNEPLRRFENNLWSIAQKKLKPKKNEFNVLNHGDFWTTNMMFRYTDDNTPTDIKVIDFQISRYGSPAFDLLHFIYGTVQEEVRLEQYDTLLTIYLHELNKSLELFGSNKRLNMSNLKDAIEERTFYAVFITIGALPMSIADPSKVPLMEKKKNDARIKSYFKNKSYLSIMERRLEEFETNGWIC
ncbi:uncharacterized protein LOC142327814 [Lycorma delicatula]|uniref:uncharacterized protein LOC142327814 n=1 Tax=Lycorma delicatula TaxID=130591 RepID=UPI003F511D9F